MRHTRRQQEAAQQQGVCDGLVAQLAHEHAAAAAELRSREQDAAKRRLSMGPAILAQQAGQGTYGGAPRLLAGGTRVMLADGRRV